MYNLGATMTGAQGSRLPAPVSMVRDQLRAGDNNSYKPHYITRSALNYQRILRSQQVEEIKFICVEFMERKLREEERTEGGGLAHLVLERLNPLLVPQVKACYDHDKVGDMMVEALSTLLLCDGCYLLDTTCSEHYLSLLAANNPQVPPAPSNNVDAATSMRLPGAQETALVRDTLFLVENQIPFVVLKTIHERFTRARGNNLPLLQVLRPYVRKLLVDPVVHQPTGGTTESARDATVPPPAPGAHLLQITDDGAVATPPPQHW